MLSSPTSRISKRIISLSASINLSFVNLGLNAHPTFFGCNASNFTSATRTPPLVVYFPHTPWTDYTNFSTYTLEYSQAEVAAYINNGVATAVHALVSFHLTSSLKEIARPGRLVLHVLLSNVRRSGQACQSVISVNSVLINTAGMAQSTQLRMPTIQSSDLTIRHFKLEGKRAPKQVTGLRIYSLQDYSALLL